MRDGSFVGSPLISPFRSGPICHPDATAPPSYRTSTRGEGPRSCSPAAFVECRRSTGARQVNEIGPPDAFSAPHYLRRLTRGLARLLWQMAMVPTSPRPISHALRFGSADQPSASLAIAREFLLERHDCFVLASFSARPPTCARRPPNIGHDGSEQRPGTGPIRRQGSDAIGAEERRGESQGLGLQRRVSLTRPG